MRRERTALAAATIVVAAWAAACGGGDDGSATDETAPEQTTTTRVRSDNDEACVELQIARDIEHETARLSGEVARQVVVGAADPVVLAAAETLAAHLSSTAPEVAAAYAAAAAVAPAAVAEAIESLAASAEATGPELVVLLRSATSADDIARLYEAFGASAVPTPDAEADPGAVEEVERYISAICGFPSSG